MFGILITEQAKITRDELRYKLAKMELRPEPFFIPIHLQPIYYNQDINDSFPVSEYLCKCELCLPSSGSLRKDEILLICNLIKFLNDNNKL